MHTMVIAEFPNRTSAEAARRDIASDVHPANQIRIVRDANDGQDRVTFAGTAIREGVMRGGLTGAIVGLLAGLLLAGPFGLYQENPFELVMLTFFGAGLLGALAGGLVGANNPERALREEEETLPDKDFLVVVEVTRGDAGYIERMARQHGAIRTRTEKR
jgi:hypothetical protein